VAVIVVVGPDAALLEGVSQSLVAAGHRVVVAGDVTGAIESLGRERPMVIVIDCTSLVSAGLAFRSSLAQGGAVIAFHCDDDESARLPFETRRATLAELSLPLERQRLLALVRSVEARAHAAGKNSADGDAREFGVRP
jgi:DNA-binding NtrC family response regulator